MLNKYEILSILEQTGHENAGKLKYILDHNIPIEDFQANLMFLQRAYGKTYMSYINKFLDLVEHFKYSTSIYTIEILKSGSNKNIKDKDLHTTQLKLFWLRGFCDFLIGLYEYGITVNFKIISNNTIEISNIYENIETLEDLNKPSGLNTEQE